MKPRLLRTLCAWMLAIAGLWTISALTGCNTTEGVGEDIEEVGEEIEDAAD